MQESKATQRGTIAEMEEESFRRPMVPSIFNLLCSDNQIIPEADLNLMESQSRGAISYLHTLISLDNSLTRPCG